MTGRSSYYPQFQRSLFHAVIRPVLTELGMGGPVAERLVFATACHESHFHFRLQQGGEPALGLWQMEPRTHDDIWDNYLRYRPDIRSLLYDVTGSGVRQPARLVHDDFYACAMCRLHYRRVRDPLPEDVDDIIAIAQYWKDFYNTRLRRGTTTKFVDDWLQLVDQTYVFPEDLDE